MTGTDGFNPGEEWATNFVIPPTARTAPVQRLRRLNPVPANSDAVQPPAQADDFVLPPDASREGERATPARDPQNNPPGPLATGGEVDAPPPADDGTTPPPTGGGGNENIVTDSSANTGDSADDGDATDEDPPANEGEEADDDDDGEWTEGGDENPAPRRRRRRPRRANGGRGGTNATLFAGGGRDPVDPPPCPITSERTSRR